jgi:taurine dioxygenase
MSDIHIKQVTANIGAEIHGIDLREPLDDESIDTLQQALLDHLVLAFPQQDITPEHQVAFARCFGEISPPPITPKYGDSPDYIVLDQSTPKGEGGDRWHSDNTFMAEPPMGSILKAVQLPSVGGDTCFSSMYAAYDDLSSSFKALVDGLQATHDISMSMRRAIDAGHSTASLRDMQTKWPPVEHPVVRTHPLTGRKALFVNGSSTTRILGIAERESEILLQFLIEHVRSPAFQCRFRWDEGTLLFWDNRSVQHFAVPDYRERRVMHRVTLAGGKPH